MRVVYAFLADSAAGAANGKVDATGIGIDSIGAPAFPVRHSRMALVVRLEIAVTECGSQHELRIELLEPDGQVLMQQVAQFVAEAPAVPRPRVGSMPLILELQDLIFPAPGDHAFHILVDNLELAVVPFRLEALTALAPPSTPEE